MDINLWRYISKIRHHFRIMEQSLKENYSDGVMAMELGYDWVLL